MEKQNSNNNQSQISSSPCTTTPNTQNPSTISLHPPSNHSNINVSLYLAETGEEVKYDKKQR